MAANLFCRIGLHSYRTVRDTGLNVYQCCTRCGRRRTFKKHWGHQPVDRGWLATGEWTPRGKPPRVRSPLKSKLD